ncbi:MAG: fibronectin type III domain-containing protein [Prevotella sp.]|jgi:hypothetical protein|nr:fibronectin type III domain-containing protein [Prevotella sp.]
MKNFSLRVYLLVALLFCATVCVMALNPPAGLKARAFSPREIRLAWIDRSTDETGFQLERSLDGVTFTIIASLGKDRTLYVDSTLSAGTVYGYRICAKNATETSVYVYADLLATAVAPVIPDITGLTGNSLSVQYENTSNTNENSPKGIDNDVNTKYLFYASAGWMKLMLPKPYAVEQYEIVSANDAPERDPKTWKLEGSNNNAAWTTIDSQQNQKFLNRKSPLRYVVSNTTAYKYYRLSITGNNGGTLTQLAEFRLYANRDEAEMMAETVNAPTNLTAVAVSDNQIQLSWKDNSNNEDYFLLQRSTDGSNWDWEHRIQAGDNFYRSISLEPNTQYSYRLRAENKYRQSDWALVSQTTPDDTPPTTIQEDWDVHQALLTLKYYNDEVAIYFDADMQQSITWPFAFFTDAWKYIKSVYGSYSDKRLYVIFHAGKYSGGHPSTWSRADHHYLNVIDLGTSAGTSSAWTTLNGNIDLPIHEIGHIMEGASYGIHGSPERVCWGDSKYAEIFLYDVYSKMSKMDNDVHGMAAQTQRLYNDMINNNDTSVPKSGCYWFRDFYFPIYSRYGGSDMLNKFFLLMSQYLPTKNGDYIRDMNYGEFFHFYSGACGADIREYAEKAFGWTTEWEYQYVNAQKDYSFTYDAPTKNITADGGVASENYSSSNISYLFDGKTDTFYTQSSRGSGGAGALWVQYDAQHSYIPTSYALTSGNIAAYAPKTWTLSAQNTGDESWTVIDSRTDESFSSTIATNFYAVEQPVPYNSYRLEITQMQGSPTAFQLAEWTLYGKDMDTPVTPQSFRKESLSNNMLTLLWDLPVAGATEYEIFRSEKEDEQQLYAVLSAEAGSMNDFLEADKTYYYKMRAVNGERVSEFTPVLKVTNSSSAIQAVTFDGDFPWRADGRIRFFDVTGKYLCEKRITAADEWNAASPCGLKKGVYLAVFTPDNGSGNYSRMVIINE